MFRRRVVLLLAALAGVLTIVWTLRLGLAPVRLVRTLRHGMRAWDAQFSPDGRFLLIAGLERRSGRLSTSALVWDTRSWRRTARIPQVHRFCGFTRDSRRVLVTGGDGQPAVWDTPSWQRSGLIGEPFSPSAAISPDGAWVASVNSDISRVTVWNPGAGKAVARVEMAADVCGFSPDSRLLACAIYGWGGSATHLVDPRTGRKLHTFDANGIVFAPDSRTVAGDTGRGTVTFWDARTGRVMKRLPTGSSRIFSLHYSPDGQMLAVSSDRTVKLFDVASGMELTVVRDHGGAAEFAPDGRMLAVLTPEAVKLWHVPPRGQLLLGAHLRRLTGAGS